MSSLIWSRLAIRDLQRLWRFLAKKNPIAAAQAIKTIRASIKILRDHPKAGKPVSDMDAVFREWSIAFGQSGYIARYLIEDNAIIILSIRHQKELNF